MKLSSGRTSCAFTLAEVVIASTVGMITVGASLYGYVLSAKRAEWSGYSLAAHSLAMQGVEQARACRWDLLGSTPRDELTQDRFPMQTNILDIPTKGTNIVWATNWTTISVVSTFPPLKSIRVDTTWMFMRKGPYTNTVVTYRAPDQ